jgi:hypothetical protein
MPRIAEHLHQYIEHCLVMAENAPTDDERAKWADVAKGCLDSAVESIETEAGDTQPEIRNYGLYFYGRH